MSEISRKGFLKLTKTYFAALGIGAVAAPVIAYFFPAELEETPSTPVRRGKVDDLPEGKVQNVAIRPLPSHRRSYYRRDQSLLCSLHPFCLHLQMGRNRWADRLPMP